MTSGKTCAEVAMGEGCCKGWRAVVPAKRSAEPGPICGRPPTRKRRNCFSDRSDCGHMSGLLMRSHMTAAKMGSTARAPNIRAVSCTVGSHGVLPRDCDRSIRSIFRSRASFGLRREVALTPKFMICGSSIRSCDHLVFWSEAPDCVVSPMAAAVEHRAQGRQGWPKATAEGGAQRP